MRRRFNLLQRGVMVVGLGIALYFVGNWTTSLGSHGDTGWTGYAPLSHTTFVSLLGLHPWVRLVIWLGFVLIWAAASIALLKDSVEHDVER